MFRYWLLLCTHHCICMGIAPLTNGTMLGPFPLRLFGMRAIGLILFPRYPVCHLPVQDHTRSALLITTRHHRLSPECLQLLSSIRADIPTDFSNLLPKHDLYGFLRRILSHTSSDFHAESKASWARSDGEVKPQREIFPMGTMESYVLDDVPSKPKGYPLVNVGSLRTS